MIAPTDPGPPPGKDARTGVTGEAMRLFGSLTQHLQALAALAGIEGREAAGLYIRLAIMLGAALFLAAFGYVFGILFAAFAIVTLGQVDWLWVTLGLAVLHILAAVGCILYVKARFRTPVFRGTLEEIRRDAAAMRPAPGTSPMP